jgi:HK97 family phage portal protein
VVLDIHGNPIETKALTTDVFPLDLLTTPALSGVSVTAQSALSVPAVSAAVSVISGALGSLPLEIFEERDGGKISAAAHPAFRLVYSAPNEWTSASDFKRQLAVDALLHGNAYVLVNRLGSGAPFELLRLDPQTVTVYYDPFSGEPTYTHRPYSVGAPGGLAQANLAQTDSQERTYSWRDVAHVKAISIDGICGVSPIQAAREAIGLAIVLEQYAGRLFGNGARPSGVLTVDGKLDTATIQRMRDSWNAAHGGANSGRTALLENGVKFAQLALASTDAQFLEMRQFAIVEIARAFNINPILLGDMGRATFSNSSEMSRQFLCYTLRPWMRSFEGAFERVLLSQEDRSKFTIEFDDAELLRADDATRAEYLGKLRAAGVLTANEARLMERLPRHASGDELTNPFTTSGKQTGSAAPQDKAA